MLELVATVGPDGGVGVQAEALKPGAARARGRRRRGRPETAEGLAGPGPEGDAALQELEAFGRTTGMPVITGDCVSPVLARVCGMHLAYYHVVANWGTGLEAEDPTITLDRLYMETLPGVAATLELALLDRVEEPTGCRCRALLRPRPEAYARALSPPAPPGTG